MYVSLPDSLYVRLIAAYLQRAYDFTNIIMPENFDNSTMALHYIISMLLFSGLYLWWVNLSTSDIELFGV